MFSLFVVHSKMIKAYICQYLFWTRVRVFVSPSCVPVNDFPLHKHINWAGKNARKILFRTDYYLCATRDRT